MMKKWIVLFVLTIATMGLVACGSGDETADEIYTNAIEAVEEMKSAEVEMEMKQEMDVAGEAMVMESKMAGSMIMDPLAMHQKGTSSITMGEETMDMEQEIYLVDNEMYNYESMSGQWIKMGESTLPLEQLTGNQMDTKEQLDMLKDYVDDLKLEETDGAYVLTFSPDEDRVKELGEELLQEALPAELTSQLGEEISDILSNTQIHQLFVEMKINKDSYQIESYDMDMEMSMAMEGEEMNLKQNAITTYKNINTVDSIEVPEEVKESAVEFPGL